MSLINQMLQDLDARRAAHGVGTHLPNDVRPLPKVQASRWPLVLGVGLLCLLGSGMALYRDEVVQLYSRVVSTEPDMSLPNRSLAVASLPASPDALSPVPPDSPASKEDIAAATDTNQESQTDSKLLVEGLDVSLRMADFIQSSVDPLSDAKVVEEPRAPAVADERKGPAKKPPVDERQDPKPATQPRLAPLRTESTPVAEVSERTPPKVVEKAPPLPSPVIERTAAIGTQHERVENDYRQAIAAINQGRIAEALASLRNILRLDGLHVASRQLLVKLLIEAKNQDEAIQVLQDGIAGQPAQIGWAMSLARLQVDRADLEGAWKTLNFSLPAAANSPDYLGFSANVLQRLGRNDEAAEQYRKATRISPGDGRWWLGLGWCLDAQGHAAEAREAFIRARQSGNLSAELLTLIDQKLR